MKALDSILGVLLYLYWVIPAMVCMYTGKVVEGFAIMTVWLLLDVLSKLREILRALESMKK